MKCSICQGQLYGNQLNKKCQECNNEFHRDCWEENGGCGTPGCKNLPKITTKNDLHYAQNSFWGAEKKLCPVCGEKIDVSEFTCPFCKENFDTNEPISQSAYKGEKLIGLGQEKMPIGGAITVFILGLIGCTAPLNLIFGYMWFYNKKDRLREEAPIGYFLAIAGLVISGIYLALIVLWIFYMTFGGQYEP